MTTIVQTEYLDRPVFRTIAECAAEMGVRSYVIGGYVRDSFLHVHSKDIDIVVEGSGIELAEAVGRRLHSKVSVFKNFGTAMEIVPDRSGQFSIAGRFYAKNPELPHRQDFDLVRWL